MATNVIKRLKHGTLPNLAGIAVQYTAPAATKAVIKEINFCNTGAGVNAVTLRVVPGGGVGTGADNIFDASGFTLAAGETVTKTGTTVLEATDTLVGGATTTGEVVIHVSGYEAT